MEKKIQIVRKSKNIIYLLATPNHGNVGDQAIAKAEVEFLENEFSQFHVVEVMFNEYLEWKENLTALISPEEIIMYHGGGNMGTEYFECETVFRDIVKRFPNNWIISFPQTVYYDDSPESQEQFEISKEIYATNQRLILTAREKKSYKIMKEAYGNYNRVLFVPDIVLYMQRIDADSRKGVLTCLRNDVERSLSETDHKEIYSVLREWYTEIKKSDTVVDLDYVSKYMRPEVVNGKLEEFKKSELVVTDRLHGMVFSYLTHTPCIVLSNYNHKVCGLYEWIKDSSIIALIEDVKELRDAMTVVNGKYDNKNLEFPEYQEFKNVIWECCKNA
ncbi:MAG: polysaccharide pyruvyl transferase family protein [Tyzzerella sp.]|nr:polysaccharide pyruvyl transferase family protein [Tyzzerella sp.]